MHATANAPPWPEHTFPHALMAAGHDPSYGVPPMQAATSAAGSAAMPPSLVLHVAAAPSYTAHHAYGTHSGNTAFSQSAPPSFAPIQDLLSAAHQLGGFDTWMGASMSGAPNLPGGVSHWSGRGGGADHPTGTFHQPPLTEQDLQAALQFPPMLQPLQPTTASTAGPHLPGFLPVTHHIDRASSEGFPASLAVPPLVSTVTPTQSRETVRPKAAPPTKTAASNPPSQRTAGKKRVKSKPRAQNSATNAAPNVAPNTELTAVVVKDTERPSSVPAKINGGGNTKGANRSKRRAASGGADSNGSFSYAVSDDM